MTRTEALDRGERIPGISSVFATGTDSTHWYFALRRESGVTDTQRQVWMLSAICPRGGFWHGVEAELDPPGVDWVPGWVEPPLPGES